MPTVSGDFLNPHFWTALGHAIGNGLFVLLGISVAAGILTFATGGTAPLKWPKREEAEVHHH